VKTAPADLLAALAARAFGTKRIADPHQPATDSHDVKLPMSEVPGTSEVQLHEALLLRALM
jgi:hypothetical protein